MRASMVSSGPRTVPLPVRGHFPGEKMGKFYSTGRAAQLRGVVSQTIRIAILRGDLPAVEIEGVDGKLESYVVSEEDLRTWIPRGEARRARKPVDVDAAPPGFGPSRVARKGGKILVRRVQE